MEMIIEIIVMLAVLPVFLAFFDMAAAEEAGDWIQPFAKNPRYWQYKGEPILLIGGSDDDNVFQWLESDLVDHLDLLKAAGGNFVRNTMSERSPDGSDPDDEIAENAVYAFKEVAADTYDLDQWNSTYWSRLERLLDETSSRDIIVSLELWDEWDHCGVRYDAHPWNPINNINYTTEETTLPSSWGPNPMQDPNPLFRTVPALNDDRVVLEFQEKFIRKVMSVALDYDNVVYIIVNESHSSPEFSHHWAQIIHDEADDAGKTIYVADMRDHPTTRPALDYSWYNFADISQTAEDAGQDHFDAIQTEWERVADHLMPLNSVKQYGGEVGWTKGKDEGAARLWRSLFGGQAGVRFHRPPAGIGLSEMAQDHIMAARSVLEPLQPWQAQPHQEVESLLSNREPDEAYLMAYPGRVYAVYFPPGGGSVDLDVSDVAGRVSIKWRDIAARTWIDGGTTGGDQITLNTPSPDHWAVLVEARSTDPRD